MLRQDEIGTFWVVAVPTTVSDLGDICFKTNLRDLMLQAVGGLRPEHVVAFHKDEGAAKERALTLLAAIRAG